MDEYKVTSLGITLIALAVISLLLFIYKIDDMNNKDIMECIRLGNEPQKCECSLTANHCDKK